MKLILLAAIAVFAADYNSWKQNNGYGYAKDQEPEGTFEGRCVSGIVHTCNHEYDKGFPGFCNGTARIETKDGKKREVIITSRVAIDIDGKKGIISNLYGKNVKVAYVVRDGLFTATSVVATTPATAP